mmetsp:Transcript_87533/g.282842  ORF Transcript_87533/g.282842 Transcript_87533/m.282842 type:complete len:136 (+) Transcript_87533:2949-3356(+)
MWMWTSDRPSARRWRPPLGSAARPRARWCAPRPRRGPRTRSSLAASEASPGEARAPEASAKRIECRRLEAGRAAMLGGSAALKRSEDEQDDDDDDNDIEGDAGDDATGASVSATALEGAIRPNALQGEATEELLP